MTCLSSLPSSTVWPPICTWVPSEPSIYAFMAEDTRPTPQSATESETKDKNGLGKVREWIELERNQAEIVQFNARKCIQKLDYLYPKYGLHLLPFDLLPCWASHDLWPAYLIGRFSACIRATQSCKTAPVQQAAHPPHKVTSCCGSKVVSPKMNCSQQKPTLLQFSCHTQRNWGFNCPHPGNVPWHSWTSASRADTSWSILKTAGLFRGPGICRCEGCSLARHKNCQHHLLSWKHAHHATHIAKHIAQTPAKDGIRSTSLDQKKLKTS